MSEQLVHSMMAGIGIDHACDNPQLIETHISWLVLLGDYAYKLKKPVDLGFLDFSTLALRKHYCEEEVRLNRRTAPDIYLDVQPISGTAAMPRIGDARQVFEYAVRMKRFDNSNLLDRMAAGHRLSETVIHALAAAIARFHGIAARSMPDTRLATPAAIRVPVDDNFRILNSAVEAGPQRDRLDKLADWSAAQYRICEPDFSRRREQGFARECHGDLHLGNILYRDRQCTLFDCIEFNEALRWIDVASDIAFTIMDVESHGGTALAWLLLNEYLQLTGDYGALAVLDYYKVYRALVRAKVAAIRASQDIANAAGHRREQDLYLDLAAQFATPRRPYVLLMSGLSGTGKTWIARKLAANLGAIHIRSDVERKRLFGAAIDADSHALGLDIYTPDANRQTFDTLARLVETAVCHQYPIVVDATFIEHALRQQFTGLAQNLGVPWSIIACSAAESTVRTRLAARRGDASEAGLAQYLDQKARFEGFDTQESRHLVPLDTGTGQPIDVLAARVASALASD